MHDVHDMPADIRRQQYDDQSVKYDTVTSSFVTEPQTAGDRFVRIDRTNVISDGERVRQIAVVVAGHAVEVELPQTGETGLKPNRDVSASLGSLRYLDDVVAGIRGIAGRAQQIDPTEFTDREYDTFATAELLSPSIDELRQNPNADTFKQIVGYVDGNNDMQLAYERGTASLVRPADIVGADIHEPYIEREQHDQVFFGSVEKASSIIAALQDI